MITSQPAEITPDLLKKALDEMALGCDPQCIHAKAISGSLKEIYEVIEEGLENCRLHNLDSNLQQFVSGLHAGYRLAQLELLDSSKAN